MGIEISDKLYYDRNELFHYGIKGMKWGVRRFQPYSPKDKKKTKIGWDDDVVVKKGTEAYRISANKSDKGNNRYLTIDENDRNFYKAMWPSMLKSTAGVYDKNADMYEQTYKLKEDLISPSAAKRQKVAADLAKSKEGMFEIVYSKEVNRLYQLNQNNGCTIKDVKNFMDKSLVDKKSSYYATMQKELSNFSKNVQTFSESRQAGLLLGAMGHSDRLKMLYGKKIAEMGYNMVIDDHGADFAGNRRRVNAPIIALKADEILNQIGSKKISDYDSRDAAKKYLEDIKTIPGKMSEETFVPNVVKNYYGTKNYYDNETLDYVYDKNNNRIR